MNDDLDEFYNEVGKDSEWVCPGMDICPKLKESITIAYIVPLDVSSTGHVKKCHVCKKKRVISTSSNFDNVNKYLERYD